MQYNYLCLVIQVVFLIITPNSDSVLILVSFKINGVSLLSVRALIYPFNLVCFSFYQYLTKDEKLWKKSSSEENHNVAIDICW